MTARPWWSSRSASCRCIRAARGRRRRRPGRRVVTSCGSGCGPRASTSADASSNGWPRPVRSAGSTSRIGVNEREDDRPGSLYNTLLVVGGEGVLHRHRKLMPTMHERVFHGVGAGDDLGVVELAGSARVGGLICWENRMPLARWQRVSGRPADLAGADRRRQRRLDRVDATHRHRGGSVRGERPPVHSGDPRSRTTSRWRCPTASTCSDVAAPASSRLAVTWSRARSTTQKASSAPTATFVRPCTPSATSTSSGTTAEPTCSRRAPEPERGHRPMTSPVPAPDPRQSFGRRQLALGIHSRRPDGAVQGEAQPRSSRFAACPMASTRRSIDPSHASRSAGVRSSTWPASVSATTTGA